MRAPADEEDLVVDQDVWRTGQRSARRKTKYTKPLQIPLFPFFAPDEPAFRVTGSMAPVGAALWDGF